MIELHDDTLSDLKDDFQERSRIEKRIDLRLTEAVRAAAEEVSDYLQDGEWRLQLKEGVLLPTSRGGASQSENENRSA